MPRKYKTDDVEVVDQNPRFYDNLGRNVKLEKIGRPTKLSEDVIDTIIICLRNGAYIETAMNFVGIPRERFYEWNKKAMAELKERDDAEAANINRAEKDEIYVVFHNAIKKAMAEAELLDLKVISEAAQKGNWQAAAWRLERKHPDRYGINGLRISTGDKTYDNAKVELVIVDQSDPDRIVKMEKAISDEIKGS
jgi:hypothetical protein